MAINRLIVAALMRTRVWRGGITTESECPTGPANQSESSIRGHRVCLRSCEAMTQASLNNNSQITNVSVFAISIDEQKPTHAHEQC